MGVHILANGETSIPPRGFPEDRADEELMTRIVSSQKPLRAYIRTLVGPTSDVDDILQEVNLVLWRKRAEFTGRGRFLAWACHVAYLQVLVYHQDRRREKEVYLEEDVLQRLAEYIAHEVERIDARLDALSSCLAKLSASQRRMILSRYQEGGSVERVAGEFGRPVGSVRVTLHQIRRLLADCIRRTLAEEEDA